MGVRDQTCQTRGWVTKHANYSLGMGKGPNMPNLSWGGGGGATLTSVKGVLLLGAERGSKGRSCFGSK